MYICIKNHYIYVMASRKLKQSNQTELMCYSLSTKKSHVHTVKYLLYLKVFPCRSNSIFSGLKSAITHIRGQNISELFIGFCFLYLHVKQKPLYMKQPLKSVPQKQLQDQHQTPVSIHCIYITQRNVSFVMFCQYLDKRKRFPK